MGYGQAHDAGTNYDYGLIHLGVDAWSLMNETVCEVWLPFLTA